MTTRHTVPQPIHHAVYSASRACSRANTALTTWATIESVQHAENDITAAIGLLREAKLRIGAMKKDIRKMERTT